MPVLRRRVLITALLTVGMSSVVWPADPAVLRPRVPADQIESTVSDGWVTLEGEVNRWRERQDAEQAVLRLDGVVGVINKIQILPAKIDPDELREQIEDALERRADREAERLRIEVKNSSVDLFGRVHSWQEKRAILGSISHAPGVTEIRDHLRVDPYF